MQNNATNNSKLTTKGDITSHDGSKIVRLGVGVNGKVLTADSSAVSGMSWQNGGGGGVNTISFTAGETLLGTISPIPVYLDNADDKVYATDASNTAKRIFIGFAITDATSSGDPVDVQYKDVVTGFSGLSLGGEYFLQDSAGSIGTTPSTTKILMVGIAVSATNLVIKSGSKIALYNGDVIDGGGA